MCVGHLSASVQYLRHLLHNPEALLVFQATFSHVSPSRLTSTTQPLATVPGYNTISTIKSKGGNEYAMIFRDDMTRMSWEYFLRSKAEAPDKLEQ